MDVCIVNALAPLVVPTITIAILHCETLFQEKKTEGSVDIHLARKCHFWLGTDDLCNSGMMYSVCFIVQLHVEK